MTQLLAATLNQAWTPVRKHAARVQLDALAEMRSGQAGDETHDGWEARAFRLGKS